MAVEGRKAALDVELRVALDDYALTMDRAGTAITDSCDRSTHNLAVSGARLDAPAVTVYVSNPNYSAHESSCSWFKSDVGSAARSHQLSIVPTIHVRSPYRFICVL